MLVLNSPKIAMYLRVVDLLNYERLNTCRECKTSYIT